MKMNGLLVKMISLLEITRENVLQLDVLPGSKSKFLGSMSASFVLWSIAEDKIKSMNRALKPSS